MACSRGCVDADAVRKMMASRVAFPCAAPPAPPSVARSPPPPPPAPPQPLPVPPVTGSLVPVLAPRRRHRPSCHRQCRCPGYRLPCPGPRSPAAPPPELPPPVPVPRLPAPLLRSSVCGTARPGPPAPVPVPVPPGYRLSCPGRWRLLHRVHLRLLHRI